MNQNKHLVVGIGVIVLSVFALFASGFLGAIGIVCGIGIIIYGKSMRFDYQRQSGSIIHKGDW